MLRARAKPIAYYGPNQETICHQNVTLCLCFNVNVFVSGKVGNVVAVVVVAFSDPRQYNFCHFLTHFQLNWTGGRVRIWSNALFTLAYVINSMGVFWPSQSSSINPNGMFRLKQQQLTLVCAFRWVNFARKTRTKLASYTFETSFIQIHSLSQSVSWVTFSKKLTFKLHNKQEQTRSEFSATFRGICPWNSCATSRLVPALPKGALNLRARSLASNFDGPKL